MRPGKMTWEAIGKMSGAGLSQRQIVKTVGVSKDTVRHDLNGRPATKSPDNGDKVATPDNIQKS